MTIIETALQMAKAQAEARGEGRDSSPLQSVPGRALAGRGDSAGDSHSVRSRRRTDARPPPGTTIEARELSFDPMAVRQNRLLLTASAGDEDRGAMAAYGMLRTRVLHRARAENWTTIGITSAAPQDGKSLTAINLALSMAREKNSLVVFLDLDMRNPSVFHTFGITPHCELHDFFSQTTRSIQDLFVSIGVENLLIAGNITSRTDSAELLASNRLEDLLDYIRKSTTSPIILIDLPPVISPEDTLVVAPRLDALLLVASEGVTTRASFRRAVELLSDFPVAGLVLNRSTEADQTYGYGYGYGYGHRPSGKTRPD
jgi:protein-tyrosine kinase